jgi:transposase-like protein
MGITELIEHVGEEHLACQWLETSLEHASIVKGQGYIAFRTESKRVMDIVNSTNPDRCLIIWFAQDRYPTEEQLTAAAASRAQAKRLACPNCQSGNLTHCEPTPQSGESPAWRCVECSIKFIVTNPSYLIDAHCRALGRAMGRCMMIQQVSRYNALRRQQARLIQMLDKLPP